MQHLVEYLDVKKETFPGEAIDYVFTPYIRRKNQFYTEHGLNCLVKTIGISAGV